MKALIPKIGNSAVVLIVVTEGLYTRERKRSDEGRGDSVGSKYL